MIGTQILNFLNICAVYFVIQLGFCALVSLPILALVLLLRKTCLKNKVFLKGMVWGIFLLVPLMGKLKLYYEGANISPYFIWWINLCMSSSLLNWIYLSGILICGTYLLAKRRKLKKIVRNMKTGMVGEQTISISDMRITPFTIGVFFPKIVLPEVMIKNYSQKELETIVLHEKTHICLGHLWLYSLWDILRCLLWINPFLIIATKHFRTDMEDICDKVSIQKSGQTAYEYGFLLLKTIKLLQNEPSCISPAAAYLGEREYPDIKNRMQKIATFQPYQKNQSLFLLASVATLLLLSAAQINNLSYSRCNANEGMVVCDQNGEMLLPDSVALHQALTYDDKYLYIDTTLLASLLPKDGNVTDILWIGFGGYYKLPGIGAGCNLCMLDTTQNETEHREITKLIYEKDNSIIVNLLKLL